MYQYQPQPLPSVTAATSESLGGLNSLVQMQQLSLQASGDREERRYAADLEMRKSDQAHQTRLIELGTARQASNREDMKSFMEMSRLQRQQELDDMTLVKTRMELEKASSETRAAITYASPLSKALGSSRAQSALAIKDLRKQGATSLFDEKTQARLNEFGLLNNKVKAFVWDDEIGLQDAADGLDSADSEIRDKSIAVFLANGASAADLAGRVGNTDLVRAKTYQALSKIDDASVAQEAVRLRSAIYDRDLAADMIEDPSFESRDEVSKKKIQDDLMNNRRTVQVLQKRLEKQYGVKFDDDGAPVGLTGAAAARALVDNVGFASARQASSPFAEFEAARASLPQNLTVTEQQAAEADLRTRFRANPIDFAEGVQKLQIAATSGLANAPSPYSEEGVNLVEIAQGAGEQVDPAMVNLGMSASSDYASTILGQDYVAMADNYKKVGPNDPERIAGPTRERPVITRAEALKEYSELSRAAKRSGTSNPLRTARINFLSSALGLVETPNGSVPASQVLKQASGEAKGAVVANAPSHVFSAFARESRYRGYLADPAEAARVTYETGYVPFRHDVGTAKVLSGDPSGWDYIVDPIVLGRVKRGTLAIGRGALRTAGAISGAQLDPMPYTEFARLGGTTAPEFLGGSYSAGYADRASRNPDPARRGAGAAYLAANIDALDALHSKNFPVEPQVNLAIYGQANPGFLYQMRGYVRDLKTDPDVQAAAISSPYLSLGALGSPEEKVGYIVARLNRFIGVFDRAANPESLASYEALKSGGAASPIPAPGAPVTK